MTNWRGDKRVTLNIKTSVISNGYFSVLRNQFISFSERKEVKKLIMMMVNILKNI